MGACHGGTDRHPHANDKQVKSHDEQKQQSVDNGVIFKVLFLGAGSTGKSTFLRAARECSGQPALEEERRQFAPILRSNAFYCMRSMISHAQLDATTLGAACNVLQTTDAESIEGAQAVLELWKHPHIQSWIKGPNYKRWRHSEVHEDKLFGLLPSMLQEGWIPSISEILLCRCRTTGIVECDIRFGERVYKTFDVGGQREERKKWIHCFENCTAVFFFLAPGSFEEPLYEDESTNRLTEDFNLWQEISGSRWFVGVKMFAILNKMDRFPIHRSVPVSLLQEVCSLLPPLLNLISEFVGTGITPEQVVQLEESLCGKLEGGETPQEFLHRRVLDLRPTATIIECVSLDINSVRDAMVIAGEQLTRFELEHASLD